MHWESVSPMAFGAACRNPSAPFCSRATSAGAARHKSFPRSRMISAPATAAGAELIGRPPEGGPRVRIWTSLALSRPRLTLPPTSSCRNPELPARLALRLAGALPGRVDDLDALRAAHVADRPRAGRAGSQLAAPDGQWRRDRRGGRRGPRSGGSGDRLWFHRPDGDGASGDAVAAGVRLRALPEGLTRG